VTTHRRALARAGAVALVATGTLVVAAPAYAAGPANIRLSVQPGATTLQVGGSPQTVLVTVENTGGSPNLLPIRVSIDIPLTDQQVGIGSLPNGCTKTGGSRVDCTINSLDKDEKANLPIQLTAPGSSPLQAGDQRSGKGQVFITAGGSDTASFDVTLKAADKTEAPTVKDVSGVVRDATTNAPIKNARVLMLDSGSCTATSPCETGTDNNGQFKFTSRPDKPITPGSLQIGASKTGYDTSNNIVQVQGKAGQSVAGVTIKIKSLADASASASPEALPSAEAAAPTTDAAAPAAAANTDTRKAANTGTSAMTWAILILAGLLVLLGVGVFVVLFMNRKKGDDDQGDDDGPQGGAPMPAGPGGPYGGMAGAGDRTMVANHAGMTQAVGMPGAGDAATAIIRPQRPEDEFPDPYAAPYPTSPAGYPPAGGYGADPYATHAGGYAPGQPGGYDPGATGYAGQPGGYGPGGMAGGEYGGQPAGYGGQPQGHGGAAPRYDEATRHWDGPGGYQAGGQAPHQGGYDQQQYGGYDQQQGGHDPAAYPPPQDPYHQDPYHQGPPQPPSRRSTPAPGRGGDQRLDWLDD
jgi:hypothetical protein